MSTPDAPQPPVPPAPPRPPAVAEPHGPDAPTGPDRPDAWSVEIVTWSVVVSAAVPLYAVSVPIDAATYGVHVAVAFGIGLLQAGALPLAMRWPWAAVAAFLTGHVLFLLLGAAPHGAPWPVSVPQMILLALIVGLLAWRGGLRPALVLWLGGVLVPLGLAFLPDRGATLDGVVANLVTSASVTAVALGAGWLADTMRSRFTAELDEERKLGAAEHERRLIAEERTRIARELHDVVAHRMSIIQVQATSAPYRLPGLDEPVVAEFGEIAATARGAMAEMRELLTVLRDPDGEAETAPQPGLDDLPALVDSVARTGLPVTASFDESVRGGALAGQMSYRIVQEALSNVLRHAPGATTAVAVRAQGAAVVVTVENAPTDAPAGAPADDGAGLGHGLIGMRERARLVGGTIEVGPTPLGGFRVHAVLPMSAPREDS
ncbi:sensor histidine kinase [Agromyces silvae]|uniref:sensor histidine kinase n=1 Tax=Agromyces silvae TaxID=3388266 RepID=UPI00280A5B5C|nr:histidine kinase [Agromyces protaetiae]